MLVTGGTGFVGSHLVELLLQRGYEVTCLVRDPRRPQWLAGLPVAIVRGDCLYPESLVPAVKGVSIVFHAAGLTKAIRSRDYYTVNHVGTSNLLEACARHNPGISKFILVSSLAAAGPSPDGKPVCAGDPLRPVSDYGRSKMFAEQATLACRDTFPVVIMRPSAVYGPRDRDVYELFCWASRGVTLEIGSGEHFINPCYVGDLSAAMVLAAERQTPNGGIYFVAENRTYSWSDFRETLLTTGGVKAYTVRIPYPVAYLVGLAYECSGIFRSRAPITNRQKVREAAQRYWVCDVSTTEKQIGFTPAYPLRKGLEATWKWYREQNWLH